MASTEAAKPRRMGLILFLVTFFGLYGSVHVYTFLKWKRAVEPGPAAALAVVLWMAVMTAAPALVRVLEKNGLDTAARSLAHVGYGWMGLLFVFFCGALAIDLLRLILFALRQLDLHLPLPAFSARAAFTIPLMLSIAVCVYGFFEARQIRTEHLVIRTHRMPAHVGRLRIAQISDVHLGLIVRDQRLDQILDRVRAAAPDMLVSTGDLIDGQLDQIGALVRKIREVQTPLGKFAVTGNHEFYAGLDKALAFTRQAGFTVLRGEARSVAGVLNVAGVDDPAGRPYGRMREVSEKTLMENLPGDRFTLLLKHRPDLDKEAVGYFDLQLSGHTHKGQIFPFNFAVAPLYPAVAGRFELERGLLYVSRGSGTWGPPVRFLAPPEVTVIDLVAADKAAGDPR